MKPVVMICDDQQTIVDSIAIYLLQEGYDVVKAYDGLECINYVKEKKIDLIILDIMMPHLDGLSTMMQIRKTSNVPIIVLSAKTDSTDKIAGLSFGADDYVSKPCDMLELLARVKSNLRRYTVLGSAKFESEMIVSGGLAIHTDYNKVTVDGEEIKLTPTEYKILLYLMEHIGQVLPIHKIYEAVWDEVSYAPENTVSVHIRRIREKIEINPKEPKYLKVVWGNGYKVEKYLV